MASSTLATVETGVGGGTVGAINSVFLYSPFGEVLETFGAQIATHRRRLNDKYHDATSGLAYYGHRYYDNVAMMWTQPDPLYGPEPDAAWAEPRRASRYTFALNNSNRYIDPDGLDPETRGHEVIFVKGRKPTGRGADKEYTDWAYRLIEYCTRVNGQSVQCGMGLHKRRDACKGNTGNNACKPEKKKKEVEGWFREALDTIVDVTKELAKDAVFTWAACAVAPPLCAALNLGQSVKSARKVVKAEKAATKKAADKLKTQTYRKRPKAPGPFTSAPTNGTCTTCGTGANIPNPRRKGYICQGCFVQEHGRQPLGEDYTPDK